MDARQPPEQPQSNALAAPTPAGKPAKAARTATSVATSPPETQRWRRPERPSSVTGEAGAPGANPSPQPRAPAKHPAPGGPPLSQAAFKRAMQPSASAEQARHREERARQPSGDNPKPTKHFEGRTSVPASASTSGIERAMGALADREHPVRRRR